MHLPLDCTLGQDCFVEDYFDGDPTTGVRDYACGLNTRDRHRGTDVALLSFEAVETGVDVLAAAPGRVLRIRDGMVDDYTMPGVTSQNACGNAVIIAHDNGFETLYCHLRQGSVAVAPGDTVDAGTPLGKVGLSGQTTHPHIHLSVLRDGAHVDPFNPDGAACSAGGQGDTLWIDPPAYDKTLLRLAGFANAVPDYTALRTGSARIDESAPDAPLVVYAELGFAQDGDLLTISATGPEGEIFSDTRVMSDPRASQLPAFGRRAPAGGWPAGEYTGQLQLTRDGRVVANRWAHVTVR